MSRVEAHYVPCVCIVVFLLVVELSFVEHSIINACFSILDWK